MPDLAKYGLTRQEVVLSLTNRVFQMTSDINLRNCPISNIVSYLKVMYFAWDTLYETLSLEEQHLWVKRFIFEMNGVVDHPGLSLADRAFIMTLIDGMKVRLLL